MIAASKINEVLARKKQALRDRCGCRDGCPKCATEFELYIKMADANVPIKYWDKTFADYDSANQAVKAKVEQYCEKMDGILERGIGLFLVGANGVGKTLTAALIIKTALSKGYTARFSTLAEILTMSTDGMYDKSARATYAEKLINVDFLVIDDITKTYKNTDNKSSTYIDVQFDQLFRVRANANLPVIVTSNHTRQQALKSADETLSTSLLSLFAEHLKDITFLGQDRRLKNVGAQGTQSVSDQNSSGSSE